ncbi:hypothetical protein [uncultured Tateyamaria sp.]|uniref:hypothetical protein n=1 Tax=uncultured Tateyamaria sp. TaxID=455651 RepID=UPI00261E0731|nr:hypothetical protein [uncultured Tateyamaria sp.]
MANLRKVAWVLALAGLGATAGPHWMGTPVSAQDTTQEQTTPETPATPMVPLETTLERQFVLLLEGVQSPLILPNMLQLDAATGGWNFAAAPQSLLDVDAYVLMADNWDAVRAMSSHVLHNVMVANLEGVSNDVGMRWFSVTLNLSDGSGHPVQVVLGNRSGLTQITPFCLSMMLHDIARFSHNQDQFSTATRGPGTDWRSCGTQGWTSVADMTARPVE